MVWSTLERRPFLSKATAPKVSAFLSQYASEKDIYMRINYVNPDHVHVLVDLPTKLNIEEMMQLLKGSSSHWINENKLLGTRFGWGRLRSILGVALWDWRGNQLHCHTGGTPSQTKLFAGTEAIGRALWADLV